MSFGKEPEQTGYDARADFTNDVVISSNFGSYGARLSLCGWAEYGEGVPNLQDTKDVAKDLAGLERKIG